MFAQGRLLGMAENLGFDIGVSLEADTLADEIVASSRIEGVSLDAVKVRSSVARQLGIEELGSPADTHDVDGAVSVMIDAVRNFDEPVTAERLFGWHNALFPTGYSGLRKITVARYRTEPMQVVSGPVGREKVHYEAPDPLLIAPLMKDFLQWLNEDESQDPLAKAGTAHLWFLTIHPFDDGNGRVARALTELLLARSDHANRRFYCMADYILKHRSSYYDVLERAQKGASDITRWLLWFLEAVTASARESEGKAKAAIERVRLWESLSGVALNERQRIMLHRLKGDFEGNLTARKWAKICKVSSDTALRDINDLIAKGVLQRASRGGRSTAYVLVKR